MTVSVVDFNIAGTLPYQLLAKEFLVDKFAHQNTV